MIPREARRAAIGAILTYLVIILPTFLVFIGYADIASGILSLLMVALGIWLSAKGMARLKRHDNLSDSALETAYRCRNAGLALGLTGSGLLVFSWQKFLARFITAASGMPGM